MFSLRLLARELRSGELRLLALALLLAVSAVSAVAFFSDRVAGALEREARQLLGADLLLSSDHPWSDNLRQRIAAHGLALAETANFPSMVLAGERLQLVEVKAVGPAYPLRGRLQHRAADGSLQPASGIPAPGSAWIDPQLRRKLDLPADGRLQLGRLNLAVSAEIAQEPDRGVNLFAMAPRLLLNLADLPGSGLVRPGSRITYRLQVAGDEAALRAFRQEVEPQLGRGERIEGVRDARPEMRAALERAQKFLGLSSLLTVVLAAVAVALAARRYLQRHLDACALLRCLGLTQSRLLRLHLAQFLAVALLAAVLGTLLGYAGHFVLLSSLSALLEFPFPPAGLLPWLLGPALALVLLLGFALPPLLQLRRVPTLRVLRRELGPPQPGLLGAHGLGLALLAGLLYLVAGDSRLWAWTLGGLLVALLVFALLARLLVRLLARLGRGPRFDWRRGLAALERRPWAAAAQIVALGLGLMALLLLTVTRGELLAAWQHSLPADAPNHFIINIQGEQLPALRPRFSAAGLDARFWPMVRARLRQVDGQPVSAANYPDDPRAQRLVEREFNLSWSADLPEGNRLVTGRWFLPGETDALSLEEGLARTLGLQVGQQLLFEVAGQSRRLTIVGLRKLEWESLRANFFVLTPPGVLDTLPANYLTSFYLPPERASFTNALVRDFPNLTVVDTAALIQQLNELIGQVARAIEFVFLFTLAAGLLVLYAALLAVLDERRREIALLRALGASRRQVRASLYAEIAALGGTAGLIAAAATALVGQVLAHKAFELDLPPQVWLLPAATLLGAALSLLVAHLALQSLLRRPPLGVLREEG
ncbi:MAG: hypothetical protein RIR00_2416 [Pseudomonadota bacterium]